MLAFCFTPSPFPSQVSQTSPLRRPRRQLSPSLCVPLHNATPPRHTDALRRALSSRTTTQIPQLVERCLANPPLDLSLWSQAVQTCLSSRDAQSAEFVLQLGISSLPSLSRRPFIRPLVTLSRQGKWNAVLNLLDLLWKRGQSTTPDERLLSSLANVAAERREYDVALQLLNLTSRYGIGLGVVGKSVLLKVYGRGGNAIGVRAVVEKLGHDVDCVLLNSAIDALIRVEDIGGAQRLLQTPQYRQLVDVASYNTLIKGMSKEGRMDEALKMVTEMRMQGLEPNQVTRNTLLSTCVNAGELDLARKLLEKEDGHEQGIIGKTTLIAGLAESGKVEEAVSLLREMEGEKPGPSQVTYAAVLKGCFESGDVNGAMKIFEGLDGVGTDVCHSMVIGLCKHGKTGVRKARAVLRRWGGEVECYNSLIRGCVKEGLYEEAESVLKEMKSRGIKPGVDTLTVLMKGYADGGMYEKSKVIAKKMLEGGVKVDRVALNAILATCVKAGEVSVAEKVLEWMENKGGAVAPGVYSYTPLMVAYFKRGKEGWKVYERMRKQGVVLNAYTVDVIGRNLCKLVAEREIGGEECAELFVELVNDGAKSGIDWRILRIWRRRLLAVMKESKAREKLEKLEWGQVRSASEEIFKRHGWNDIDSGWRVI